MTATQVAQVIDDNFKNQNKILEEDIAKQNSVIGVSEYKDFSEAEAVNVGDVRKYNGFLYECVEATTGAFEASKWKKSSFKAETEKKLSELENNMLKSNRTSLSLSDLSWENGNISDDGKNSTYDEERRLRSKGYVYLKAGDCFRLDASVVNRSYIFYYNEDLSFETSTSDTEKLYSIKSGFARILLIPKTDSIVGLSLLEYVNYIPYNYGNRISVEDIDSRLANIDNSNDFGWENGHINPEGYNASYDDNYRIRSKMMYVKKGDVISLIRTFGERYIVFYYNENKILNNSTNWLVKNTRIEEDGFVRILMAHEKNGSWGGIEALAASLSVVKNGEYDNCNIIEWELGGIKGTDGSNYSSESSMRTKNIIHVKAGTIIVPYVFGRYLIAYYDEDGNFIKRMPNDGEGEHNDGYYSQNAFEFTEDANVRFILFWMSASTFYEKEGFEHIIPNTVENLPLKFRIIPPKYEMPYYIKKVIDDKNVEIISLGDMFRLTFLTDPHEYFYHEMAAVYCAEKNCNFLVNGGDLHSWPVVGNSTVIKTVNRHMDILVKSSVPVVMTKGNHESCLSGGNDYSTEMWYSQTQKQLRKIDYQYDGTNETLGYFFVDDEKNKVRLICLNIFVNGGSHLIGSQQRIWLMNVALDLSSKAEDEKNWSVIAVGHSQIVDNVDPVETKATMEEDWVARVFRGAYNKTKTDLNSERFDFSTWTAPDFSNIKYQFVAYICGHSHYDNVSRIMDFPHITTASAHPLENDDKYRRVWDSVEEYAFDVYCLDTKSRNLIIKRIGVGSDREVSY